VLARRPEAYVVLNKFPYSPGHLMVVPTRHVPALDALDETEHDALFRLVRDSVAALGRAVSCQGVNVGMNLGRVAGAGIEEHLHVHVVPRWQGDNNFMPVIADVRVMPECLEDTWVRLAPEFARLGAPP
jgi:ATP adenylyltransferase